MNYLITRCTTWDMAGICMIDGFRNGITTLDQNAKIGCLVAPQDIDLQSPYVHYLNTSPDSISRAFEWADVAVDLGGVVRGNDPFRIEYLETARKLRVHYVYGAISFLDPRSPVLNGVPAIARGEKSAQIYELATGHRPEIGADLFFLVEPKAWKADNEKLEVVERVFSTHAGKPFLSMMNYMFDGAPHLQVVLKRDQGKKVYEPRLPGIEWRWLKPSKLLGLGKITKEVYTSRYHVGAMSIYWNIPCKYFVEDMTKYNDLEGFRGLSIPELKKLAMKTCDMAYEYARR